MYDRPYIEALNEWFAEHESWERGEHKGLIEYGHTKDEFPHFANYGGNAPDVDSYRPAWKPEEMTWYQVYETVSEGTPVTPPFATQEELIEYLVENGDFWDQKRRAEGCEDMACGPWKREVAEHFVRGSGWAPSFVDSQEPGLVSGVEFLAQETKECESEI